MASWLLTDTRFMDGGHLFKERECGHKRLLFFNAHRIRQEGQRKGWRVIRRGMPYAYALHATGGVSLQHFSYLYYIQISTWSSLTTSE